MFGAQVESVGDVTSSSNSPFDVDESSDAGADRDPQHTRAWKQPWALAAAAAVALILSGGYLFSSASEPAPPSPAPASWDVTPRPPQPPAAVPATPGRNLRQTGAQPPDRAQQKAKPGQGPKAEGAAPVAGFVAEIASAVAPMAGAQGLLLVVSRVPLEILLDGKRLGSSDDGQVRIPAGPQRVEFVNKRLNYKGSVALDIQSGKTASHTVTLPSGRLKVTSAAGAEVWVEGEHVGTAPVGELAVPLGARDVVVRHPQLGERRQSVDVLFGSVTEASLTFDGASNGLSPAAAAAARLAPLSMAPAPRDLR
jgi:hypothetical protein